ncbi:MULTISPECIES: siderophore-iron reductase FhuF [Brenneria]|uniref:Siderophore-iron reductase FhuF n=1 Tax=Brenneria nigrifluens DSM 30175 = ATCC 13028 TaxID=1121120 RepID=A0A2U1URU1_9GAMM|nr:MULTISPECIES: siderophore-iron reductase FhuF [Brenneria]EHD23115.1 ferric iron reductase [Brenneria sp. EniD312]PWC24399.1 siderophore-iron reductase FhuF [Brenneria nigrifluens DSM 30175 = ATCC 13028]QCR05997.1 siderophore-iron reductase FhuF [Brenneria nigrifluens DSM 30175 = ATCC 13028]
MPTVKNIVSTVAHPAFSGGDRRLAAELNALLRRYRPHCLDSVKFGEVPPEGAMTLAEWSRPEAFQRLVRRYGNELYRQHPDKPHEEKPLQSLWAQWYFGLLVPPLMLVSLKHVVLLDCSPSRIYVEFHASKGHPAVFYIAPQALAPEMAGDSPRARLERLLHQHIAPVINTLDSFGALNARLTWNNTGYLMHWFLGEMAPLIAPDQLGQLRHDLFFSRSLLDGGENPLYRTIIPRGGLMRRRSCCQRYRIPDVARCGDCTLNEV